MKSLIVLFIILVVVLTITIIYETKFTYRDGGRWKRKKERSKVISNMKESIFKVEKREDDLIRTDEYWQSSSFADMQSSLVKNLFIKKQYLPHRNMKVFRELSFLIKASVTVFRLLKRDSRLSVFRLQLIVTNQLRIFCFYGLTRITRVFY